ncbi:MAG: signal peptidase II [Myxococcaceae bacterium]|nr:signal peptidase II [Myxococcaceae bacterium]
MRPKGTGGKRLSVSYARRFALFGLVTLVSIALDQWTKALATEAFKGKPTLTYLGDVFRFQFATNEGAFLSLGGNLPEAARFWLLTVGVGGLLLAISVHALRNPVDAAHLTGYALIVSGGVSNWLDRARFGGVVVDFMNLGLGSLRTGVFNVADLAILGGIGVLLVAGWRLDRQKARAPHPPVGSDPAPAPQTPRQDG